MLLLLFCPISELKQQMGTMVRSARNIATYYSDKCHRPKKCREGRESPFYFCYFIRSGLPEKASSHPGMVSRSITSKLESSHSVRDDTMLLTCTVEVDVAQGKRDFLTKLVNLPKTATAPSTSCWPWTYSEALVFVGR